MTFIYALETLFMRIFIKPLFHWIERLTGISFLNASPIFSLLCLLISLVSMILSFSKIIQTPYKNFEIALIAPVPALSIFAVIYSGYLIPIIFRRYKWYYLRDNSDDSPEDDVAKDIEQTSWIAYDPRRVLWCLTAPVCILIMHQYANTYPFILNTLFPFCCFGPILMFCGVRPYFKATEKEQRLRIRKEQTTIATITFVGFTLVTYFLYHGDLKSKILLYGVSMFVYILILKNIRGGVIRTKKTRY